MKVKIVNHPARLDSCSVRHDGEQPIEIGGDLKNNGKHEGCYVTICGDHTALTLWLQSEDDAVELADAMHQLAYMLVAKRDAHNAAKPRPVELPGISADDKSDTKLLVKALSPDEVRDMVMYGEDNAAPLGSAANRQANREVLAQIEHGTAGA